jgi:hypothetical protein
MPARLRDKQQKNQAAKPMARLTASLMKRQILPSADVIPLPRAYTPPPAISRPLPRLTAILRSRDTRLFISVSSAAFTFILGFIG